MGNKLKIQRNNDYNSDGILIMAMEYQMLESHLLSKKGSFKDFPFGPNAAVFKVAGKMFGPRRLE